MAGYLVAEEGPLTGLIIRMEEGTEWIIGRDPDVSFQVLEDPMVSRKHLICRLTEEGFVVENLSSTNPASVNGNPITDPMRLQEDDMLQVGSTLFKFTEIDPSLSHSAEPLESHPTIFEEETPLDTLSLNEVTDARWMLKVISGPNTGAEFGLDLNAQYIIGKDPHTCDIIFQDLSVSRQHAKISVDAEYDVAIEDLSSRNGTYVNGRTVDTPTSLSSQDLIALGTTSFLLIDREQTRETIYSPTSALSQAYETTEEITKEEEELKESKKTWKELLIPTRHLILVGAFLILLLGGIVSTISLFKTHHVEVAQTNDTATLAEALKRFPGIEYSFNSTMGKIFVIGDVLTEVDKQELFYLLKSLPFIHSIEDNVVIDEIVWSDMNAFLARNPSWRAVTMIAYAPGKFTLKGYVETMDDATSLSQYVAMNFPYNEKLENQVVVANTLEMQVQSILVERGFVNVTFQLGNGELVLSGRVNENSEKEFMQTLKELKKISGIRSLKNFVIITTASTTRINLSDKYKVTGTSKLGNISQYVVINGQILTMGDPLDGMMITQIEGDAVLLEKDGLKYRINYNQQ
jgi:type III secretion system YscD/HrpQ family protein